MTVQIALDRKSGGSSPARASLLPQGPLLGSGYKFARADINVRGGAGANREARAETRLILGSTRSPVRREDHPEISIYCRRYEVLAKNTLPKPRVRLERLNRFSGCRLRQGKRREGETQALDAPLSSASCSLNNKHRVRCLFLSPVIIS